MQPTLGRLSQRRDELGDEGGFTLIELLIVIVILGILAAFVVFAVQSLASSSAQASCGSDVKAVEVAVEAYKAQMGNYPSGSHAPAGTTPDTDTGDKRDNAAAAGGELLTGSLLAAGKDANGNATANNASPSGAPVGPWLKDVPANGTHYTVVVANAGRGTPTVENGRPLAAVAGGCSGVG